MSKQNDIIQLIRSISGQASVLTIPRVYISIVHSHRAALFLSQCVYWSDRSTDGWFFKSFRGWYEELGLNQHAIETCVKALKERDLIETKVERVGTRDTTFYRPSMDNIAQAVVATLAVSAKVTLAETAKVPKRKTLTSSIRHRLPSEITEHGADEPRPRDELFDAIAESCSVDPDTAGSSIGKVKTALLKAKPPYTADEVRAWRATWPDWKDKPPTLWQLKEQIGAIRVKPNGNGGSNTKPAWMRGIEKAVREAENGDA